MLIKRNNRFKLLFLAYMKSLSSYSSSSTYSNNYCGYSSSYNTYCSYKHIYFYQINRFDN